MRPSLPLPRPPARSLAAIVCAAAFVAGCASTAGVPAWTFTPEASPPEAPAAIAAATSAATAAPSPSAEASVAGGVVSFAPIPVTTAGPSPSFAPPDPGEPGFVAGTKAKPRLVDVATSDALLFDPAVVTVAQGETITFRIHNSGTATHEFKVGLMTTVFADGDTPEVADITPGSTKTITYTFDGTGPYAFGCHAPGHFENGMYGFVNVAPSRPFLGTPSAPRMVVIRMDDTVEFVPTQVSVTAGETILFVLPNVGSKVTHEFQVGPADRVALDQVDGQIVVEQDQIQPGHVSYLTYTFGGPGPYAFACHEPGHYEAGMKGTIEIGS